MVIIPANKLKNLLIPDVPRIKMFSNNNKFLQYLAFSMLEAALFPKKLASHFLFDFLYAMLGLDPNPVQERKP
jgi:hypothetical protein